MNHQIKIEHHDPADLRGHIHPTLKTIPELSEESEEFLAIAAGVGQLGIRQPLQIDDEGRILDDHSRTLLRCALRWQMKTVPVIVVPEPNVPLTIISGLAHRRHLTKSGIAYLSAGLIEQAFTASKHKRLENLANSQCFPKVSAETPFKTAEDLATEIGIGRNLLFEARKVHELFADKRTYTFNVVGGSRDGSVVECTLREWFEPRILMAPIGGEHEQNRPLGLGGVIAGTASVKQGDKGKFNPKDANQLELFTSGLNALAGRALKLSPDAMRKSVRAWLDEAGEKFDDQQLEQLEQLADVIKAEAKQLRKSNA